MRRRWVVVMLVSSRAGVLCRLRGLSLGLCRWILMSRIVVVLCWGGNRGLLSWRWMGTSFLGQRRRGLLRQRCWSLIWRWDCLGRVLSIVRSHLADTSLCMMTWSTWSCLLMWDSWGLRRLRNGLRAIGSMRVSLFSG
jgi:hypothetical protein